MKEYIGIKGSNADYELNVIHETSKAYLVESWLNDKVWLPKSCFDEEGILTEKGYDFFLSKLEE